MVLMVRLAETLQNYLAKKVMESWVVFPLVQFLGFRYERSYKLPLMLIYLVKCQDYLRELTPMHRLKTK